MKIAVVTTSYPRFPGDFAGHFVATEVAALRAAGHEVEVFAPGARAAFGAPGTLSKLRAQPWLVGSAARFVYDARDWLQHTCNAGVQRIDAHWALPSAWPVAAFGNHVQNARARLHVTSHGSDARLLGALPSPLRMRVTTRIAQVACSWRFVSAELVDAFSATLDAPTRRALERVACVAPAAIDVPDVSARVRALREEHGAFGIVVARLVPSKRVDAALKRAALEAPREPVVVVGDGPERARLFALARAMGLDARFVGTLPREETLAWIGAARCMYFASCREGASTVLREAQALGTPTRLVA